MSEKHLDPLALARHLGGDAGWWARRRQARHLARCPACRARLQQIEAERAAYDAHPQRQDEIAALVRAVGAPTPAPRRAWGPWAAALAMTAAAVALILIPPGEAPNGTVEGVDGGLRAKGGVVFALYLDGADTSGALPATCRPGDRVRARIEGVGRWVMVIAIDPAGQASALVSDAGASMRLGHAPWLSPGSWALDAAPGVERFVAVFSDAPLDLPMALRAMRAQAADPLAPVPGVTVIEHRCTKAGP